MRNELKLKMKLWNSQTLTHSLTHSSLYCLIIVITELEKKLKCRAEKDSLIQKNILPGKP
jgi:hypothetical protein